MLSCPDRSRNRGSQFNITSPIKGVSFHDTLFRMNCEFGRTERTWAPK